MYDMQSEGGRMTQRNDARLWEICVAAFPPYEDYQERTSRTIPVFVAEPA